MLKIKQRLTASLPFLSVVLFLFLFVIGSSVFMFAMRNIAENQKGYELQAELETAYIKLEKEVASEIAVVLKLADSPLIKRYFADPTNPTLQMFATEEINSYRNAFSSFSIFWVNDIDKMFYSDGRAFHNSTSYLVDPEKPDNYWYNMTLYETEKYNFNVNYNPNLQSVGLWVNAPVIDNNNAIGMVGTGIDLTSYINMLYDGLDEKTEFYLFNRAGEITGSRDMTHIIRKRHIDDVLSNIGINITDEIKSLASNEIHIMDSSSGKIVIGEVPMLGWYAIMMSPVSIYDYDPFLLMLFVIMFVVIALILVMFNIITARITGSLNQAILSVKAASKIKSDFLAKMSHEIRTPMNAIIGMAEIALREGNLTKVREHVLMVKHAGMHLLSLINDILDFSKIEAGKMEIVSANYQVVSMLNDVISIIRMRIAESLQVLFVVNVDHSVPSVLYGDEVRIRQILLNILSNAVKFTKEGYISLSILSETDGNNATLTISIADSGKGIKSEDMNKLFSEFTQVDLVNNKDTTGTGLGLAITRNLVRAMGGKISLTSEYGVGTTFTITLPQKIYDSTPLASVKNPETKRVLVYELREIYANSIVYAIDNLGVDCTLVLTVSEFRSELESGVYNYVFVAANLYEDVCGLCKEIDDSTTIVLLAVFGEICANRNLHVLAMPVYSISIANILNGEVNSFMYKESNESTIRFTAPDAKILIVDDIDTNLAVAQGLLMPYEMQLTLCNSGTKALEAIAKETFDLIFMDHMMSDMDGIEATAIIRENPVYKNIPIIALTANAVSGAREMFMESGFDDFISKPIDILKLDNILEKWIPEEKQKKHVAGKVRPSVAAINPKLLEVFRHDTEKAVNTLRNAIENGDMKLFAIIAHAMKSALGNIGEHEKAKLAFALEMAGQHGDKDYVAANANDFIGILESLIQSLSPAGEHQQLPEAEIAEDREFLRQQLLIIQTACENYDEAAAYATLNLLQEKQWKVETLQMLKIIHDMLYLHSDFEEAEKLCRNFIK